jgi:hypothetical protein
VRAAEKLLREATVRQLGDQIEFAVTIWGEAPATWMAPARETFDHYRVPDEVRTAGCRVLAQLSWAGEPGVTVFDAEGAVLWSREPTRNLSPPVLRPHIDQSLLTAETSGNGHEGR